MTEIIDPPQALSTAAARSLATTTKTVPQMLGLTPRWLLRLLPWVQLDAGAYRVNRRRSFAVGDGRISVSNTGDRMRVLAADLRELAALRQVNDPAMLCALADLFEQHSYEPGEVIAEWGHDADRFFVVAHGKATKTASGPYGAQAQLGVLTDGDYFDQAALLDDTIWDYTVTAVTPCVVLSLRRDAFRDVVSRTPGLRDHLEQFRREYAAVVAGEQEIALTAGHSGQPELPETFVDYEEEPREYELSVAQTVLRVHSRVTDIYNEPINQLDEQLRLTVQAIREQQEWEIVNNRDFGLRHAAAMSQRVPTRTGPPTPDDLDELLTRVWKEPAFFLAHPRAIAAFGRECTRRGVPPPTAEVYGSAFLTWRGVPLVPCDKLPIDPRQTTDILLMRVGEDRQGVIGLHQTGIPDEYAPSLSVRPMGVDTKAIASYLVTAYYSAAVLVDDALAVLENVEISQYHDYG